MKWENSQQVTLSDEQSVSQITLQEVKSTCQDILGVVIGSHNGEAAKNFGKMSIPWWVLLKLYALLETHQVRFAMGL